MPVLHDEVLIGETDCLASRRSEEADDERVELERVVLRQPFAVTRHRPIAETNSGRSLIVVARRWAYGKPSPQHRSKPQQIQGPNYL